MKGQFDHQVMQSFLLWFDHTLLLKGEAYTNTSGQYYDVYDQYDGFYSYALPYKQIVSDHSITGASGSIPTGVYLGGDFITPSGTNGPDAYNEFRDIDYDNGTVNFVSGQSSTITSNYSVKDFSTYLSSETEEKLLFETKYKLSSEVIQSVSGLAPKEVTYPVVFLIHKGTRNEGFTFAGMDQTIFDVRALVLADSQFDLDGVGSIFRDKVRTHIAMLKASENPFNVFGGYKSHTNYNYTGVTNGKNVIDRLYINEVAVSKTDRFSSEVSNNNPDIFFGMIDFEAVSYRYPRGT
jgi:hypothetical protein